jgi:DNA-binding SARP family transcriptional activator
VSAGLDWGGHEPPPPQKIRIETLGRLAVWIHGREIALPNRKSRALIGYLALTDRGLEFRERLVGLFWSEAGEDRARASLRQTLHGIRASFQAVGFDGLRATRQSIALDLDRLDIDLWQVSAEARAGRAHRKLIESDRPIENLLADVESVDPAFQDWVIAKRRSLHDRILLDLEQAMRTAPGMGSRVELARALVNLDSTHEEAVRALMSARAEGGDARGAIAIYGKLRDQLEADFQVEPSDATRALVDRIKAQHNHGSPRHQPPDMPGGSAGLTGPPAAGHREEADRLVKGVVGPSRLVVSLGPFDVSGVPEARHYLVHEFRRDLVASLVQVREWLVRDRGDGDAVPGEAASATERFVLDAGAFQIEDELRLVLALREATTGTYVWSERVSLSPGFWRQAQQTIVRRLASALDVQISARRLSQIGPRTDVELLTYEDWLRGQAAMRVPDLQSWNRATAIFRDIIDQTPNFAPSYSSLAKLYNTLHMSHYGLRRHPARVAEALRLAQESVRLDAEHSRAKLYLGWAYVVAFRYDEAVVQFDLIGDRDEEDPWTIVSSGLGLAVCGETLRAIRLADRALSLTFDPSPAHWGYHGYIEFLAGNYHGALDAFDKASDLAAIPGWRTATLFHLGRQSEAEAEFASFLEISRMNWCGSGSWSEAEVVRWFLQAFPFKVAAGWERLRDGLCGAGAPGHDLVHGFWELS